MMRGTSALVIFLLLAGTLLVVSPIRMRKTDAQTTSKWNGTVYIYGSEGPDIAEVSLSFSFVVGENGQISGGGSGSAYYVFGGQCTANGANVENQVYTSDVLSIVGSVGSNGAARLNVADRSAVATWECGGNPLAGVSGYSFSFSWPQLTVFLVNGFSESYSFDLQSNSTLFCAFDCGFLPGSVTITLHGPSQTLLSCTPDTQLVGMIANCEAVVFGNSPTGTVTFTASSDEVGLGQASCQLSPDPYGGPSSFCQTWVKSPVEGNFNVTAHYPGDRNNPSSDASTSVTFVKPDTAEAAEHDGDKVSTYLSLSCDPSVVNGTLRANCTAKVAPAPAVGNIPWTATNPAGVLSTSTCALVNVNESCGTTYFQGNASQAATITAAYTGDTDHLPKQASSTITVLAVGVGTLDQRQATGFVIKVSGSSGATVNASSTYYHVQPNDTGKAPFASNEYYDLRVSGTVNGNVEVCHFGANVNSTTSLDYYHDGAWTAATDVVATAGVSVCGDIPAAALKGTPLDIGGSDGAVSTTSSTTSSSASSTATASSLTGNSQPSATSSTTSPSGSSTQTGGGIPEFPYQLLAVSAFVALVVVSYMLVRRGRTRGVWVS